MNIKGKSLNGSIGASPGKGNKNKNTSWVKLGLSVISAEAKVGLTRRIAAAQSKGAKVGPHFIVGFNNISKLLESTSTYLSADTLSASASTSGSSNTTSNKRTKSGSDLTSPAGVPAAAACAICMCRDSPIVLQNRIVEAAFLQSVPVVLVPAFTEQLASMLGIKRANGFALPSAAVLPKRVTSGPHKKKRRLAESQKTAEQPDAAQIQLLPSTSGGTVFADPATASQTASPHTARKEACNGSKDASVQDVESLQLEEARNEALIAAVDELREHLLQLASQGHEE